MRKLYLLFFILFCYKIAVTQCEGLSVDLPDDHQPVVNPSVMFCVSFEVNPAVTGHPIGVNMHVFHTFQGDLSIRVFACGNTLMLMTRPGGGSCNAGPNFGSGTNMDGFYSFMDGGGPDPDIGVELCGGGYGLSGDPCGVNTVSSFSALSNACGSGIYTFEVCFTDHAAAFAGFADNIQLIFPGGNICGCMDPDAISFNPFATIESNTCCYPPCNLTINQTDLMPDQCNLSNGLVSVEVSGGSGNYIYQWNTVPPQTGATADDLSAGNYTLNVTDSENSGCTGTFFVNIPSEDPPDVESISNDPDCTGDNGSILINTSGGSSNFSYEWSHDPSLQGAEATNLPAGQFSVTITDTDSGCEVEHSVDLDPPEPIAVSSEITQPTCEEPLGIIEVVITGGTGEFMLDWTHDPTLTDMTATDLVPGFYQVFITDVNNLCTGSLEVEIIESPSLDVTADITTTTCNENNGGFSLFIDGGDGPYQVNWFGQINGTGDQAFDLPAGLYFVEVLDITSGCTQSIEVEVPDSDPLIVDPLIVHTTCGEDNGLISIQLINGSGFYEFNWTPEGQFTGPDATDLPPGIYNIMVTDVISNCEVEEQFVIDESEPLELEATVVSSDCGQTNGSISVQVINGSGDYFYFWSTGSTSGNTLTDLNGGNYGLTVTDIQTDCEIITSFVVGSSEPFDVDVNISSTTCGDANGSIEIIPLSGSGNYSYNWVHDPNLSGNSASGLAGNIQYIITVTDVDNDCSFILTEWVEDSDELTIQSEIIPLICEDDEASITVSPIGGSGNYLYEWINLPAETGPMISDLTSGNYAVNITDQVNGCTNTFEFSITAIEQLSIECNIIAHESGSGEEDGSIFIQTEGGTGVHTIQVIRTATSEVVSQTSSVGPVSFTFEDLAPGMYEIVVVDQNGCEQECELRIDPGDCQLILGQNEVIHPLCPGQDNGAIEINTTGGVGNVAIEWFSGQVLANDVLRLENLLAGVYTISGLDIAGCTDTLVVSLIAPPAFSVVCTPIHESAPEASDGQVRFEFANVVFPVRVDLSGPLNVQIDFNDTEDPIISGLEPGVYEVIVVDENGCETQCTFTINSSDCKLEANISSVTDVSCFGQTNGEVEIEILDAEGIVEITWNHPSGSQTDNIISGLEPANYVFTLTDELGCIINLQTNITEPDLLEVIVDIEDTDCTIENGQISLVPVGGIAPFDVIWEDGSSSLTRVNLAAGQYLVTVTDKNGCVVNESFEVRMKDSPIIDLIEKIDNKCHGENDGSISIQTIPEWDLLTLDWSNGLSNVTEADSLSAGNYSIKATDANGCMSVLMVEILENNPILIDFMLEPPDCGMENGIIELSVTGGVGPYQLVEPFISDILRIEDLGSGTYQIVVMDSEGCIVEATTELPDRGIPEVFAGESVSLTCSETLFTLGEHLDLSDDNLTYQWYFNDETQPIGQSQPVIETDIEGIYILEVKHLITGCTGRDTLTVDVMGEPIDFVDIQWQSPSCEDITNGQIDIIEITGGTPPYVIYVNGEISEGLKLEGLAFGDYFINIADQLGCVWPEVQITLLPPEPITLEVVENHVVILGDQIDIEVETNVPFDQIANIRWEDENGVICDNCSQLTLEGYVPTEQIELKIELTTLAGCVISATTLIRIIKTRNIYIPSAFSPNLDNVNDNFYIFGDDQLKEIKSMRIFDRWGNMMFEKLNLLPDQQEEGWRGMYRGHLVDPGVFIYVFEVIYEDGEEDIFYGEVAVLK